MKKYRKTITVILIILVAVIMFASFFGINIKNKEGQNRNIIPNLKLGMEFGKKTVITATVNKDVETTIYDSEGNVVEPEEGVEYTEENGYKTEEKKINPYEIRTVDNFRGMKKIIEERLNKRGITEYFIELNEQTGTIQIELPENDNIDEIESFLKNSGAFMLLDGETFEAVFETSQLKEAKAMYNNNGVETGVFLQIDFNKEGKQKLKELSEIYVETTSEETNENGEVEEVSNAKTVWVILNDALIGQTVIPNILYNDSIMLTFAYSSDEEEIQTAAEEANKAAILLNSGTPKILYDFNTEEVETNITPEMIIAFVGAIGLVFIIAYICMVIIFKARGFIATYFQIGFLATLLLILRLTSATITIEGIAGIVIAMILEYVFSYIVLNNMKSEEVGMYKKSNLEFFLDTIPMYVIAIVFTFANKININSFGVTLFWGIITIYVYNFIFSKFIFENLMGGKNENN